VYRAVLGGVIDFALHLTGLTGAFKSELAALIVSTGEDLPPGHSVLARVLVVEVCRGDVNREVLTDCQRDAAADWSRRRTRRGGRSSRWPDSRASGARPRFCR
jgi:hypothetical protein